MAKTLCDWSRKDIAKNPGALASILAAPAYVCAKCARAANTKKALCCPKKLALPKTLTFASPPKKKSTAA